MRGAPLAGGVLRGARGLLVLRLLELLSEHGLLLLLLLLVRLNQHGLLWAWRKWRQGRPGTRPHQDGPGPRVPEGRPRGGRRFGASSLAAGGRSNVGNPGVGAVVAAVAATAL